MGMELTGVDSRALTLGCCWAQLALQGADLGTLLLTWQPRVLLTCSCAVATLQCLVAALTLVRPPNPSAQSKAPVCLAAALEPPTPLSLTLAVSHPSAKSELPRPNSVIPRMVWGAGSWCGSTCQASRCCAHAGTHHPFTRGCTCTAASLRSSAPPSHP